MPKLRYIGADPAEVGVVPLPEGWPAADHEEADETLGAAKVESGSYELVKERGKLPRNAEVLREEDVDG